MSFNPYRPRPTVIASEAISALRLSPPHATATPPPTPRVPVTPPGTGATVPTASRAGESIATGARRNWADSLRGLGKRATIRGGTSVGVAALGIGAGVGLIEGVPEIFGGRGPLANLTNPYRQPGTEGGPPLPGTEGGKPLSFLEQLFGTTPEGKPVVSGGTIVLVALAVAAVMVTRRKK